MESQRDAKKRNAFEEVSEAACGRINSCNSTNNESSHDTHSKTGKKITGGCNKNTKNNDKNNNKNSYNNDTKVIFTNHNQFQRKETRTVQQVQKIVQIRATNSV